MIERYRKFISCVVLLLFFVIFTYLVKNYFQPFFIVLLLIFVCNPIFNCMIRHKIFSKKTSAILTLFGVNIFMFILLLLMGNSVVSKVNLFMDTVYINLKIAVEELLLRFNSFTNMQLSLSGVSGNDSGIFNNELFKRGAVYTTESFFAYFIGNIIVYFTLIDKATIINFLSKLIYTENINFVRRKYNDINKLIKIEAVLILITTIETIFGLLALNIENAVFLGFLSGVLDVLPYVGIVIVFLPLILYKFYTGSYIIAVGLIILYILLIFSRQVMEAKFMSNKLKIHPLPIILSLYIGMKIFGIIGLIVGPIYVITAKDIIMS